jgi:hypothetical protein
MYFARINDFPSAPGVFSITFLGKKYEGLLIKKGWKEEIRKKNLFSNLQGF